MSVASKVYIVLVNYHGWRDTLECLESLFRLDYPEYAVIVVDNGSQDDSCARLIAWSRGEHSAEAASPAMSRFSQPAVAKPIAHVALDARDLPASIAQPGPLVLIRSNANLGFAGGCNLGLRYALARDDFGYVWLLNNDTVVAPDALTKLVATLEDDPHAGMCGSTLLDYAPPNRLQAAAGGIFNPWTGTARSYVPPQPLDAIDERTALASIAYIIGASMLVTRSFLRDIGLMNEEYFLYYEELDWAYRARGRYTLAYAKDSVVYHKEGGSIGTSADPRQRSELADYYGVRNRIRFTRRYRPYALPVVYLGLLAAIVNRLRRGQARRIPRLLKAMFGG